LATAAEMTLAVRKPWAIRPPKGVLRANSSLRWMALLSPEAPANRMMSRLGDRLGEGRGHPDLEILDVIAVQVVHVSSPFMLFRGSRDVMRSMTLPMRGPRVSQSLLSSSGTIWNRSRTRP
jgi:hypothetical protein